MAPWVRRTLAISCEAVPAVSSLRGHEAAPPATASNAWRPGAAESLVSFIALFGRPVIQLEGWRTRALVAGLRPPRHVASAQKP